MGTVNVKMVIRTLVVMLLASSPLRAEDAETPSDAKAEAVFRGREQPQQPQEANDRPRDSKQLWPLINYASYYTQQGHRPIVYNSIPWQYKHQPPRTASGSLSSLILATPTPLLSATSLFSKYTKTLPKKNYGKSKTVGNQHGEGEEPEWNYRVSETSAILSSDPLGEAAEATAKGGLNSTKNNLAEDMTSEAANLIGSLSRHAVDSLDIENLNIQSRQNLYGPELDIRPLEIPGAKFTPGDRRLNGTDIDDTTLIPFSGVGRPSVPQKPKECCLFVFLDGSAYYFDEFMRKVTGFYRVMYGSVNGHPHYVARNCQKPDEYGSSCTYIWYSGYGWVVGVGRYIGQTKGVMFTRNEGQCPTDLDGWRYLDQDLTWQDNGNIYIKCAS